MCKNFLSGKYRRKDMRVIVSRIGILFISKFIVLGVAFCMLMQHTGVLSALSEQSALRGGIFTAYTASVAETDDSPTITASNQEVRRGIIANNCLPFGTRIVVNNEIYEVQDRMNTRYGCDSFDIFMWDHSEAKDFGRQELEYQVI
jgi:3D (Asp-Asp-Asp) domain-containing protein